MECIEIELNKVCRTCKTEASEMKSLYLRESESGMENPRIDEMLMACASVQVDTEDNLPKLICQSCFVQLKNAYMFKDQCQKTDIFLRDYVQNIKKIKEETELAELEFTTSEVVCETKPLTLTNEDAKKDTIHEITNDPELQSEDGIQKENADYIQTLDNNVAIYKCTSCSKECHTLEDLRCHKKQHTNKVSKCKQNVRSYTRLNHIQRHELAHRKRKLHVCKFCNRTFTRYESFKRHLITHLKDRPFSCPSCNRSFTRVELLEKHVTICKGKRMHICDICNRAFLREDSMQVHKREHENADPVLPTLENLNNIKEHYLKIEVVDEANVFSGEENLVGENIQSEVEISDNDDQVKIDEIRLITNDIYPDDEPPEILLEKVKSEDELLVGEEQTVETDNGNDCESNKPMRKVTKYKQLTIREKIQLIALVERGEKKAVLAKKYGITDSAIAHILKNKEIYNAREDNSKLNEKRTRVDKGKNAHLEELLLQWIKQKRSLGICITGPLLRTKALSFNVQLNGPKTFKASQGWLTRFKNRFGIRQLSVQGEKLSADTDVANDFKKKIWKIITEEGYSLDNVYNADETGLYTKSLPRKTLAFVDEKQAPDYKESKERVTIMNCSNATGSHRVPLLLIGKSARPRCFKNVVHLPVVYRGQESAWMNNSVHSKYNPTKQSPKECPTVEHSSKAEGEELKPLECPEYEVHTVQHDLKLYECQTCKKRFSQLSSVKRHRLTCGEVKPFRCGICNKFFSQRDPLENHMKLHLSTVAYTCDLCQAVFKGKKGLAKHVTCKHNSDEMMVVAEKKFKCQYCPEAFTTVRYRDSHAKMHVGEKKFQCKTCEKTFISKSVLTQHMKFHNDNSKKFLCSECGQKFVRNDFLIIHMRRHRGEKPFECKFCGKGFARSSDLTVHERYHTGEKTHLCVVCGRGFARAYSLTVHMRTHTGEKPYRCTYCNAAFAQGNDLKAHVRRHTGERFQCELCPKTFVVGYLLTQHKRVVHGLNIVSNIRRLQSMKKLDPDDPPPVTVPLPAPIVITNTFMPDPLEINQDDMPELELE